MQQIPCIDLFKSALHVSGDKSAHPQEHFLAVYTAFGTMHRYCCRPVHSNIGALHRNRICCILLIAYIVVLMMHGLTNLMLSQKRSKFPSKLLATSHTIQRLHEAFYNNKELFFFFCRVRGFYKLRFSFVYLDMAL